jgi:fumarylacetoacetate (FAA) hydrolase
MNWTFAELIAHASRNTRLRAGDLIGSGTVGTGCILESPEGTHPWLRPGDVVRLEIEGIGVLENRVVE